MYCNRTFYVAPKQRLGAYTLEALLLVEYQCLPSDARGDTEHRRPTCPRKQSFLHGGLKQCLGTRNEARARRDGCTPLADVL